MTRVLRYVSFLLFPGALAVALLPLIQFGPSALSVVDCLQLIGGHWENFSIYEELLLLLHQYLEPFLPFLLFAVLAIFVTAVVALFLPEQVSLYLTLIFPFLFNLYIFFLFGKIINKLNSLQDALLFFSLDSTVSFHLLVVTIWCLIWLLCVLFSILGLTLHASAHIRAELEDILPEMIDPTGSSNAIPYLEQIHLLEQQSQDQNPSKFSGAIIGVNGIFFQKAYPLQDRIPVCFISDENEVFVQTKQNAQTLAILYYVGQYQEYCIKPLVRHSVFLASGQPLGLGRKYFLPRGTKLYFLDRNHAFSLA